MTDNFSHRKRKKCTQAQQYEENQKQTKNFISWDRDF